MQFEFEIILQDDQEMIFQNDGTARRIVVRNFDLWVPQLHFTGQGQTQWKYLKETLNQSSSGRDANGTWLITPGVKNPQTCLYIHSTNSETKCFHAKPLFL